MRCLAKARPKVAKKSLRGSRVLLGVTGSVAAHKAIDLARRLTDEGASVRVVMTDASSHFVTELSLETACGGKVHSGMMADPMSHILLPKESDLMIIAPCTADTIAKLANGMANDLLSACYMAFKGQVLIAPAMNWRMYESPALRRNMSRLEADGAIIVPPCRGKLACGEEGVGKMADISAIIEFARTAVSVKDLEGKKLLVTAGPTREKIDDVRFISNPSTGKMGYAIAKEAARRGAQVVLVSGPTALEPPHGVETIRVETAEEMMGAVMRNLNRASAVIMAAAVGDFTPERASKGKLDKSLVTSLKLKKTPDILLALGKMAKHPFLVGFSAEHGENISRAKKKLTEKGADMIVLNDISRKDSGFGVDTNKITIIGKSGAKKLPLMSKDKAAGEILDALARRISG